MSFLNKRGYDDLDSVEKEIESRKSQSGGGKPFRFFMKVNETRNIVFLTDNPPVIDEHNLKINGKWGNTFTCLKNLGEECPLCEAGDRPSTVGFYVVVDKAEWKDKNGNTRKNSVRILAAKFKSLKQFKKFSSKYSGLVGVEFEVERTGDKAAAIGDTYIKETKHDEEDLIALVNAGRPAKKAEGSNYGPITSLDEVIPDWEEYLKPATAKELAKVVGSKSSGADPDDDEAEVTF